MDEEIWLPIPHPELGPIYAVSNTGKVKRTLSTTGRAKHLSIISGFVNEAGYRRVELSNGIGRRFTFFVHRLVATAFIGPPPTGMECCHCDGNPLNNNALNLRWDSRAGNVADMDKHGSRNSSSPTHGVKKLNFGIATDIKTERNSGASVRSLAKKYNVSASSISRICNGRSWKTV